MSNTHYSLLITHYFKIKDSWSRGFKPQLKPHIELVLLQTVIHYSELGTLKI